MGEGSLVAVSTAPALFRSSTTTSEPGTWAPGNRTLNGFNIGSTVSLQVRVWDSAYGSTWEAFIANPSSFFAMSGYSCIFQYTIPTDPVAPLTAFTMTGFRGFYVGGPDETRCLLPEPATFALAGLGAAMLLIRRRK